MLLYKIRPRIYRKTLFIGDKEIIKLTKTNIKKKVRKFFIAVFIIVATIAFILSGFSVVFFSF